MAQLLNRAEVTGVYDEVPIDDFTELSVELTALNITKVADKTIWVKDDLTYTIEVENIDDSVPPLQITDVVVRDVIEPTIATLVAGSVQIDGVPATEPADYTYDPVSGLLTVTLGTISVGTPRTITFRTALV